MNQAQAETVARAIADALVESNLIDFGAICDGGEADDQVRPILLGLCENVCAYLQADAAVLAGCDPEAEA